MVAALHILFSAAGAGALRQALVRNNCSDEVICLHDDLSFGPIDSLDPDTRIRWLSRVCRLTPADWSWFADDSRMFWSHASSTAGRRVVWSTRTSAREFAGFLAYLDELGDRPFTMIDGTNLTVPVKGGREDESLMSFGELGSARMYSLLNTDRPLGTEQIMAFRARWATLRKEGALLRVVAGSDLTSVPLDFFDQALLSVCNLDWQRAIRVIATAMFSNVAGRLHAVDEMLLCSRVMALIESGLLETREDVQGWPGDSADARGAPAFIRRISDGLIQASPASGSNEGTVSKRQDSPYRSARSPDWLKMKNPACAAVKREEEEDWGR